MSLPAPDPRASLSLTETRRNGVTPFELDTSRTRSRRTAVSSLGRHDSAAPSHGSQVDGDTSSSRSTGSADIEKRWTSWLCVFGSFLFLIPSYGFMQTVGTVQSYLQLNQLSEYSARDVGWVTGMYLFLALFLGLQAGPLVDVFGPTRLGPVATAITIPMFFLMAECTAYWHFMLCLGVLGGAGAAVAATVAVSTTGKLFVRYRGLAVGLALSGSSVGGVVFPLMLRHILPMWGWKWSMRTVGFISLGLMVMGCLCFLPFERLMGASQADLGVRAGPEAGEARVEPAPEPGSAAGDESDLGSPERVSQTQTQPPQMQTTPTPPKTRATVNFAAFKSPAFSFVTSCTFLLEFVVFGITGILPTIVAWSEFPPETGFVMIAILNGLSCLGRVLPGVAGDHLGHFNVLLAMCVITVLCTAVTLVPFGSTYLAALYVFSALWGFGSGSFLSLTPVCVGKTCEAKDYGRYFGTMNFVVSFGLLITVPISGQMLESMGATALSGLFMAVLILGAVSAFAARSLLVGTWFDLNAKI